MTSLAALPAVQGQATAGPTPFTPRLAAGLTGVLIAVLVSGFNEHVIAIDLPDLQGALGISHDDGTWLTALYEAFQISAMAFAPWCAVTFSLRRFTVAMTGLFALLAVIAPFMPNLASLYVLRAAQGFAGGALPPMLMTVVLRYLPPSTKVYGLGAYGLTATFGPNLSIPIAASVFESLGWRAVFWEAIPLSAASIVLVIYGMPKDPLRLERFRQFDWRGLLLGFPSICMIVIALMQGDRLDWFRSALICHLFVGGAFLFGMFLLNEWFHPLPFFRIQMLRSRDLSFSLIGVALVLLLAATNIELPTSYLVEVQGYRPWQVAPMALVLALPQLITLPLVAYLCSIPRIDCRWVLGFGAVLMGLSSYGDSQLTSDWYRGNFYFQQTLQVFGQPMVIVPILMIATMKLAPTDGPFVSGMFNMVKGLASVIATGLVSFLETWREHTHSNILLDRVGENHFVAPTYNLSQDQAAMLASSVRTQALVLTAADISLVMAGIAGALIVLVIFVPTRVYPPISTQPSAGTAHQSPRDSL